MSGNRLLPLGLGLLMFSFFITSIFLVPFIDLLYKLKMTRKKKAPKRGKVPLFDKLHDIKAGTPIGGGVLIIIIVTALFGMMVPIANHMGIDMRSSYDLRIELFVIFFTFLSFGILGFLDDYVKIFGEGRKGERMVGFGLAYGLTRRHKFFLQWALALFVGWILYVKLGIDILHIPLVDITYSMGPMFVPFAAFVIVSFTNAFNITDGLDGLSVGLLAICLIAFGAIAAASLDTPLSAFISLWVGALIAFLYFNVWPARVFLGDAGALSFGAMLAVIGLLNGSIIALVVIGGVFVVEIVSSAVQILGWKILKKPILPLAPVHHSFLAIGWEEPKIVMRAWLMGIMLAIFGLWLASI